MHFLIYTLGRTGSTLLTDLVNHFPRVKCEGEILSSKPVNPFSIIDNKIKESKGLTFGFKVKTSHLCNPRNFLETMQKNNWKFIHLNRHNPVDICISYMYARQTSFFYYKTKLQFLRMPRPKIELNAEELIIMLSKTFAKIEYDNNLLSEFNYLTINYELDLQCNPSHRNTLNIISDYLELSYFNGKINIPTSKSIPSHATVITNWKEICDRLQKTPYAIYL